MMIGKKLTPPSLGSSTKSRKDRRSKLEIYHDILTAITKESPYGEVKPTRIQFMSNTSYDKLITYFDELEKKQMLVKSALTITEKGQRFLKEYHKIDEFVREIGHNYLVFTVEEGRGGIPKDKQSNLFRPFFMQLQD